jgi:hypothetical protein
MEFMVDLSTDKPRWRSERVAGSCSYVKITRLGGRKDREERTGMSCGVVVHSNFVNHMTEMLLIGSM